MDYSVMSVGHSLQGTLENLSKINLTTFSLAHPDDKSGITWEWTPGRRR